jgi:archaemetzincin
MFTLIWQLLVTFLLIILAVLVLHLLRPPRRIVRESRITVMRNKLYVVPLDEPSRFLVDYLIAKLTSKFDYKFQSGLVARLPEEAFNPNRGQFFCSVILNKLQLLKGNDAELILAVTDEDLFLTTASFVFGHADPLGRVAIVSTHRLRPEFYGLPQSMNTLKERLLKVAIHQLGHINGLSNCDSPECVMFKATNITEMDDRQESFCPKCLMELAIPTKVGKP